MTVEEYYTQIKNLGLKPSNVPTTYFDNEGLPHYVQNATEMTAEQRIGNIKRIKASMGIEWHN